MKKNIFLSIMMLSSVIAFSQIRPLQRGQNYQRGQQQYVATQQSQNYGYQPQQRVVSKNNTFQTLDDAKRAYASNSFTYYQPSDLRAYSNNPVDGVTKIKLPLERDAFVKMVVVGGILYVIIPKYSECRFYVDANGCVATSPYAFDMCGNAIYEFEYAVQCDPCNQQANNQVNLNNYSERPIQKQYQQQYVPPTNYKYNCNNCPPVVSKKGWSTGAKIFAIVGTAALTYAIYSYSTKKSNNNGNVNNNNGGNGDQTVITGGASYVPKNPSIGLSFGVGF